MARTNRIYIPFFVCRYIICTVPGNNTWPGSCYFGHYHPYQQLGTPTRGKESYQVDLSEVLVLDMKNKRREERVRKKAIWKLIKKTAAMVIPLLVDHFSIGEECVPESWLQAASSPGRVALLSVPNVRRQ